MIEEEECEKSKCEANQNSTTHDCYDEDGFERQFLHRAWLTGCKPPYKIDMYGSNPLNNYLYEHVENYFWGSTVTTQCIHGYKFPDGTTGADMINHRQTSTCEFDTSTWEWNPPLAACEPIYCNQPPPTEPDNVYIDVQISANQTNDQKFETNLTYACPANVNTPGTLAPGFALDFNVAAGHIQNITLTCESNGKWRVHGGYPGDR